MKRGIAFFIMIFAIHIVGCSESTLTNEDISNIGGDTSGITDIYQSDIISDKGEITDDAIEIEDIIIDTNESKDGDLQKDILTTDEQIFDVEEKSDILDIGSEDTIEKDAITTDISNDVITDVEERDTGGSQGIYKSNSDPYSKGGLSVKSLSITTKDGSPVDATIYVPQGYNEFAVVVFQHGFLVNNIFYSDMLEHIASHGFVVVAPQMYKADGIPLGKPKTPEEADKAIEFYNWLKNNINNITKVNCRIDLLGLAGHSRGGKVVWTILLKDSGWSKAVAGVDPVDGTGGPLGGESRIADKPFNLNVTSLIIGTGLGPESVGLNPACAPEGDNHIQFYNASSSPAYHSVAVDYGHMDMLNDSTPNCGMVCTSCKAGPDRANMRKYTGAQLTAFFRYTLQGDNQMLDILTNESKANIKVTMEHK
jgi:chlorophyllase